MARKNRDKEEPFILAVLPFAGLGLLLVLALLWRSLPEGTAGAEEPISEVALERWEEAEPQEVSWSPDRDFVLGPDDAPVTIVEFTDFECPYCRTASSSVKRVRDRFGDDVKLVFKNLPLDQACNPTMQRQLHANACRAALLARCAGLRERDLFWEVHDRLFLAPKIDEGVILQVARELDLDLGELEDCMESESTREAIGHDISEAQELGVTGTPTFFINGKRVHDYRDDSLERIVERALEAH
ncbi:MAG TPA: thioredoxin domain-containing protein [Vicinamibacteria bacterium]|nr:thioredoxin domain-containing protein [Vicinamibacteria bacterium]